MLYISFDTLQIVTACLTQKGMYIAKLFQKVLMNLMATPYYRVFGESTEYYTHILLFISFCSENDVFLKGEGFRRVDLEWFVVAHFRINSGKLNIAMEQGSS